MNCLADFAKQPGHLAGKRPIIIDDSYTSPESSALHEEAHEGDLAEKPEVMNVMSNFAKPQPPQQGHGSGTAQSNFYFST